MARRHSFGRFRLGWHRSPATSPVILSGKSTFRRLMARLLIAFSTRVDSMSIWPLPLSSSTSSAHAPAKSLPAVTRNAHGRSASESHDRGGP